MSINRHLFKWHWGDPNNPTEIRSWMGAFDAAAGKEEVEWKHCFTTQRLKRWFGLSYKSEVFFGVCVFSPSFNYRSFDPPAFRCTLRSQDREPSEHPNIRKDGSKI